MDNNCTFSVFIPDLFNVISGSGQRKVNFPHWKSVCPTFPFLIYVEDNRSLFTFRTKKRDSVNACQCSSGSFLFLIHNNTKSTIATKRNTNAAGIELYMNSFVRLLTGTEDLFGRI
jgi:hypothetical protein